MASTCRSSSIAAATRCRYGRRSTAPPPPHGEAWAAAGSSHDRPPRRPLIPAFAGVTRAPVTPAKAAVARLQSGSAPLAITPAGIQRPLHGALVEPVDHLIPDHQHRHPAPLELLEARHALRRLLDVELPV